MSCGCIFCFEQSIAFLKISGLDINEKLKTVFPMMVINIFENRSICIVCLRELKSVYEFIKSANENNNKIHTLTSNNDLCQICIQTVENTGVYLCDHIENEVPYYEIKEMLDYSSLDLDIESHEKPVICSSCWKKLKKCYLFLKRCVKNEEITSQYLKRNINSAMENITGTSVTQNNPENVNTEIVNTNPVVKIEFDENTIKVEHIEDNVRDDIFSETVECLAGIETVEHLSGNVVSSVIYIKEEPRDPIRKELYVKLNRLTLKEIRYWKRKKSKKPDRKCQLCPFTALTKYKLNRHMLTHMTLEQCAETNSLYECHLCPYRTKRKFAITRHLTKVHRSAYVCEKCDFETNIPEAFTQHIRTEHDDYITSYACDSCSFISHNKTKLLQHVKKHQTDNMILRCNQCDFETKQLKAMEQHKIRHKHMRCGTLYKCEKCKYQAKKRSSMNRHVLTHLSKKELTDKLYPCSQCQYKTKRKDSLPLHIKKKHAEKK